MYFEQSYLNFQLSFLRLVPLPDAKVGQVWVEILRLPRVQFHKTQFKTNFINQIVILNH